MSGASDYEVSIPRLPHVYPSIEALPGPLESKSPLGRILRGRAEVGTSEAVIAAPEQYQAQGEVSPTLIEQPSGTNFESSAITVGEKIFSIRQVLKRFHRIFSDVALTTLNPSSGSYAIQSYKVAPPLETSAAKVNADLYDYFSYIYAFYRGSFRFKIMPYDQNIFAARVRLLPESTPVAGTIPVEFSSDSPDETRTAADVYMPRNIEGVFEMQVPHYSRYPILPVTGGSNPTIGIQDLVQRNFLSVSMLTSGTTMKNSFYRAVGDDFSFNQLLGAPFISRCTSSLT